MERRELDGLTREELIARAEGLGVPRPRVLTKAELVDEIWRAPRRASRSAHSCALPGAGARSARAWSSGACTCRRPRARCAARPRRSSGRRPRRRRCPRRRSPRSTHPRGTQTAPSRCSTRSSRGRRTTRSARRRREAHRRRRAPREGEARKARGSGGARDGGGGRGRRRRRTATRGRTDAEEGGGRVGRLRRTRRRGRGGLPKTRLAVAGR